MATQRSGTLVTYEDYRDMPEDERYEIIDGELVMAAAPSVVHQLIQDNIGRRLSLFVHENNLGRVLWSATDVLLSEINVVQPDILFISRARASIMTYNVINGAPDLVVEILSPSNTQHDTVRKRELYARFRVPEYWQADSDALEVTVLTLAGDDYDVAGVYKMGDTLVSPNLPGFALAVEDIFDSDVLALLSEQS